MLEFARWKYYLVVAVSLLALVFAAPNFFGEDLAVQVGRGDRAAIDATANQAIEAAVKAEGVVVKRSYIDDGRTMLLFDTVAEQLKARDAVNAKLSETYVSALARAPRAPAIFRKMGLRPMPLGLDLRGGLNILYQVDVNAAVTQLLTSYEQDYRRALTDAKIVFTDAEPLPDGDGGFNGVRVTFPAGANLSAARDVMRKVVTDATYAINDGGPVPAINATLNPTQLTERKTGAIQQNIVTLNNRVNELGVTEPEVRRQGPDRISVSLPGVTNSAEVKDILGKVATLEFRLTDTENSVQEAVSRNRPPVGSRLEYTREGRPTLLKREIIATGENLVDATSTIDQNGQPAV
jgi:preprotein translocase subunit SecD